MSDIRKAFERCTESYYEGDFTKYETNGDYVSEQQQDDFVMFQSGFHAGRAHDIDGLIAEMHHHVNSIPIGRYNPTKGDSAYNWGKHYLAEFSEIIRKHFGKE
jgi:hypothetical protein